MPEVLLKVKLSRMDWLWVGLVLSTAVALVMAVASRWGIVIPDAVRVASWGLVVTFLGAVRSAVSGAGSGDKSGGQAAGSGKGGDS